MRNLLLSTAALTLLAAPAMAQSLSSPQVYGTLGYTQLNGSDGDLGAVTGRVGAKLNRYFGVEGEASVGVHDDNITFGGVDGRLEHRYDAAAYGVATLPLSPNLEVFGRVGYGTTEVKSSIQGFAAANDGRSVNYGVGANYFLDDRNGVRADWTRRDFQEDNGGEADAYSLSYVRRF